jgi:ketosteroid isomerase-like protein
MSETQVANTVTKGAPAWVAELYAPVDALSVDGFLEHLTEDVSFRFGNAEPAVGHQAVGDGLTQFYGLIKGMSHTFLEVWENGDDSVLVTDVDYTRPAGDVVRIPAVTLVHRRGELVDHMQIFIDVAPLMP